MISSRGADRRAAPAARTAVLALMAATLLLLPACGNRNRPNPAAQQTQMTQIGVNTFLWRASLDTLQFMPMAQVDSAGGVIVTDWFQNPGQADERIKVTVAIMDGALRADAVQVSANRQIYDSGRWVEAPVRAGTVQRLEEMILQRARALRQAAAGG
ncbi:MAG: DUF3576 domain-containing protein [Thermaurantiacus sp.]